MHTFDWLSCCSVRSTLRPYRIHLLALMLIIALVLSATVLVAQGAPPYDATFYVSATGSDATGDGTQTNPWATLAKAGWEVSGLAANGNYQIVVMSDLTMSAAMRVYDRSVTITSLEGHTFTVTRGTGAAAIPTIPEFVGGATRWFNPPMLELEGSLVATDPQITMTIENIIFDDAFRYEGTVFQYRTSTATTTYVQDAIVASWTPVGTIVLGNGGVLKNYGGMTAIKAGDGASVVLEAGSLITENSTTATRQVTATTTDYRANSEAAVSVSAGGDFFMYSGAKIENIANAHSVKLGGSGRYFIDGEICNMKGYKGWDVVDQWGGATHEGRGFKCAVCFAGGPTLDPETGVNGPAIIGPNANIHHNAVKCGAIGISRNVTTIVRVFGKVNDNAGQSGTSWQTVPGIGTIAVPYGTNGGGIFIVNGGTAILEEGSEVCRNSVQNIAYGGGVNVQQAGSKLIMNGGLVQGNTAGGMGPGIAVNKSGDCYFEMNGGVVDNGPNGVLLFNNRAVLLTAVREDSDCNGRLILNAGTVSGVTVNSLVAYGTNTANQYRNLFITDQVVVQTGYIGVAGNMQSATSNVNVPRQVTPLPVGGFGSLNIGNPNKSTYPGIRAALPTGWTLPTDNTYVIGFWIKKAGTCDFSVPAPTTGTGPANYDVALGKYFAAVQETTAAGAAVPSAPVRLYPCKVVGGKIIVSVPLGAYPNGATVVLVQPSTLYGEIVFDGPIQLGYDISGSDYTIPYTGVYHIPTGFIAELIGDGYNNTNTTSMLYLVPDPRTEVDLASIVLSSDIFEAFGSPTFNTATGQVEIPVRFRTGWESATNLTTSLAFDATMASANFTEGDVLSLTGYATIIGNGSSFYIPGTIVDTLMVVPRGDLIIAKEVTGLGGDALDVFTFTVTFSDGETYTGTYSDGTIIDVVSGAPGAVALSDGESIVIADIVAGVTYEVVEVEANQNGYVTTSTGATGTITEEGAYAEFTNDRGIATVQFLAGIHGTMAPDPASESVIHGQTVTGVPAITPAPNWVFIGWLASTGGLYTESQVLALTIAGDVTFTAQYAEAQKATVVFDYAGGKDGANNGSSTVTGFTGETYVFPTDVTRPGYKLTAWVASISTEPGVFGEAGSVVVFTAQWTATPPDVTDPKFPPMGDNTRVDRWVWVLSGALALVMTGSSPALRRGGRKPTF